MHLPIEDFLHILEFVPDDQMCSLVCVSKDWCGIIAAYYFQSTYVKLKRVQQMQHREVNALIDTLIAFKNTPVFSKRNFRTIPWAMQLESLGAVSGFFIMPGLLSVGSIYDGELLSQKLLGVCFLTLCSVLITTIFIKDSLYPNRDQLDSKVVDDATFRDLNAMVSSNKLLSESMSSCIVRFLNQATRGTFSMMKQAIDQEITVLQTELVKLSDYVRGLRFRNVNLIQLSFLSRPEAFKNALEDWNKKCDEEEPKIGYHMN